ncbi:hypothetical protein [Chryseobacterium sp. MMS23-Vi53]|uniref:hypothetical protein n=1 Tax=Chryseobacterium sp. MMS23-Vi53 TaxID=3386644 RepID=UPI0039E98268
MISQVSDIQMSENLSFDEAFLKTQKLWESEFKMTSYSAFYNEQIPVIVKKIAKAKYNNIIKKSLFYALISLMINLLFVYFSTNVDVYTGLSRMQNCLFVLTPFLIWIFDSKMRKYVKQDYKYQGKLFYTMYQKNLSLFAVSLSFMFQVVIREDKHVFEFFRTKAPMEIFPLSISLFVPFLLQIIVIFVLINFFEHKKTLTKMQNFLKISTE